MQGVYVLGPTPWVGEIFYTLGYLCGLTCLKWRPRRGNDLLFGLNTPRAFYQIHELQRRLQRLSMLLVPANCPIRD